MKPKKSKDKNKAYELSKPFLCAFRVLFGSTVDLATIRYYLNGSLDLHPTGGCLTSETNRYKSGGLGSLVLRGTSGNVQWVRNVIMRLLMNITMMIISKANVGNLIRVLDGFRINLVFGRSIETGNEALR